MPEMRRYTVVRVQQVKVVANSHEDAEKLAVLALDGRGSEPPPWGSVEAGTDAESATLSITTERA